MKKCIIYGNCQAEALKIYLKKNTTFTSAYRILEMKPVHLLSTEDISYIEKVISEVDLFIYQPVSDNYKGIFQLSTRYLTSRVKAECQKISFPVAYFSAYNPELSYLKNNNGIVVDRPFVYHDLNILKLFDQGKSTTEILTIIQDENYYKASEVEAKYTRNMDELKLREADLDIKLSGFIENNFRNERLFHVFNHPNKSILIHICVLILKLLGINDHHFHINSNTDMLSKTSFPIYPSLAKHLKIQFLCEFKYRVDNKVYYANEIVKKFTDFYAENSDIVRLNIEKIQ